MIRPVRKNGRIIGYDVVHGSPRKPGSKTDKPVGAIIKRFKGKRAKTRAEKMHAAIRISQARAAGHYIPRK